MPGAKITLTDTASGSTRDTVTNAEGYYSFSSVPVGSYSLNVEAANFESYKAQDVRLGGGERRNLNVTLKVGSTSETVEVNAEMSSIATLDSGEKSFALTTRSLRTSPKWQQCRRVHQDRAWVWHHQRNPEQI